MELILGTYENFLLGYKFPALTQTFNIKQHNNSIKSISINNKTGMLASGGADENIHLLNLKSRKEFGCLFSHNDKISKVHFHEKTGCLYSISEDGTVVKWEYKSHTLNQNTSTPKNKKSKPIWDKTNTLKTSENNKLIAADIHNSGNLMVASDKTSKQLLFISLINQGQVASKKKLRGTQKSSPLDLAKLIKFYKDDFFLLCEKNIIRFMVQGQEKWKHVSEINVVHDFVVLENKFLILAGERNSSRDGKRVRFASVEFLVIENMNKNQQKEDNFENENQTELEREPENPKRSKLIDLYEDGRIKTISYEDTFKSLISGDSNGLLTVYKVDFTASDFPKLEKSNQVDVGGRITCHGIYKPELKRKAEEASVERKEKIKKIKD